MHHASVTASATYTLSSTPCSAAGIEELSVQRTSTLLHHASRKTTTFYVASEDAAFINSLIITNLDNIVYVVNYLLENDVFTLHHMQLSLNLA